MATSVDWNGIALRSSVQVLYGRWAGRSGVLVDVYTNIGGAQQQAQSYPVVRLDKRGRARSRVVRVLDVKAAPEIETYASCSCGCGCEPDGDWHWSQRPWCPCINQQCPCVTDAPGRPTKET